MKVLYITSSGSYHVNAIVDYDSAFARYSENDIYYFDILTGAFRFSLDGFDALIFSYSFWAIHYGSPEFLRRVAAFRGPKIAILHDEYITFLAHRRDMRIMGINAVATLVPEQSWQAVYGREGFGHLPHLHVLAGYVPSSLSRGFSERLPLDSRRWIIGYRGRTMAPIYGKLAREKYEIGVAMRRICRERGISADIEVAEDKRIYGEAWPQFIRQCRVLLGTESGSNVFDFDGSMAQALETYQADHPDADFDELHAHCIGDADGIIRMNQISPKFFETIALGTGHMLFEGEYSGILKPWKHYIPLKKDYSNLDEALAAADDLSLLDAMIRRSYEDVILSDIYSCKTFIRHFDAFLASLPFSGAKSRLLPSDDFTSAPPGIPAKTDFSPFQRREMARVARLAAGTTGRNILFYGCGKAFQLYSPLFTGRNTIHGIFLDEDFLPAAKGSAINGIRVVGETDLDQLRPRLDMVIVFCRLNWRLPMTRRMMKLFQETVEVQTCTLYSWDDRDVR